MVFTQAFTFNVLGLGAANIAIGPLFVSIGNNHTMLIDATNVSKYLAVEENRVIDDFVSDTPIPAVMSMERHTGRPASALETNQVTDVQLSFNGSADIPLDETFVFPTRIGNEREIGCVGRCSGCPDA
jgi:hypothetical protein